MEANLCCNGQTKDSDGDPQFCVRASIIRFVKRRCMWKSNGKKKKKSALQEAKQNVQLLNNHTRKPQFTLADWIIASPQINNGPSIIAGGEFHGILQLSNSKVYPSFVDHKYSGGYTPSECRRELSDDVRKMRKAEQVERSGVMEGCLLSSGTIARGKAKKKVRFSVPEVDGVFMILDSPEPAS